MLSLIVRLGFDGKEFANGLAKARAQANHFGAAIGSSLKSRLAGFAAVAAGGFGVKETIDYASKVQDLSERLGVSTGALQELDFAARLTGGTLDDFSTVLQKLAVTRKAALDDPGGDTAVAFQRLGISADQLRSARLEDLLHGIGAEFNGLADPQERIAEMVQVLGRGSPAVFAAMRAGLREAGDEARNLGLVMDAETIRKLDDLGDSFSVLMIRLRVVAGQVIAPLAEGFIHFTDAVRASAAAVVAYIEEIKRQSQGSTWELIRRLMLGGGDSPERQAANEAFTDELALAQLQRDAAREARQRPGAMDFEGREDKARDKILNIEQRIADVKERARLAAMNDGERRAYYARKILEYTEAAADAEAFGYGLVAAEMRLKQAEAEAELAGLDNRKAGTGFMSQADALQRIGGVRGGTANYAGFITDVRANLKTIAAAATKTAKSGERTANALNP
jgi:hypothetical protein